MREAVGRLVKDRAALHTELYSLHHRAVDTPGSAEFLPSGGTLGFCRRHPYVHTSDRSKDSLPSALRSAEMVLFTVSQVFGLEVRMKPVMDGMPDV